MNSRHMLSQTSGNVSMALNFGTEEAEKDRSLMPEIAGQVKHRSMKDISSKKVSSIRRITCYKRFLDKSQLLNHVTVLHAKTNILICNICGKTFLFKKSFHRHLSTVHLKLSVGQRKRRSIQRHTEKNKCSFQDGNEDKDEDKDSCNDKALSGKCQKSDTDCKLEKCSQSNRIRERDLKKIKHVNGKYLPKKRRRKYTQRARPDLCLRYFGFKTCKQYLNHRIKWKYCRRVSRKNKKWKNLKKPEEYEGEKSDKGRENTELTESVKQSGKHVEEKDCTEEGHLVDQLNSITELVVDLDMPTICENKHIESNGKSEAERVVKKYLPCKKKLKSHQDHSYGKISSIFLNMINDTNNTTNSEFSENRNNVNHVISAVNNLPEVNTIPECKDTSTRQNYAIEVNMGVKMLVNKMQVNSPQIVPMKHVIRYPINIPLKDNSCSKTKAKSSASSKSNLESLKNDPNCKRKVKKVLAVCFMCKEVYSLMHHLRIKQIATQNNGPAIDCPFCKVNFPSLAHLETHITSTHLKCEGKTKTEKKFVVEIIHPDKPVNYQNNEELVFECHCCPRRFDSLDAFNSHIINSHTRVNAENAKATAKTLTKIKEILASEIVETIFGKDSDTIEDNLKQGARITTNIKNENVETSDITKNLHFNLLLSQKFDNNNIRTLSLEENKVTEHTPVKKDVLDKLISDLGIQGSAKQEVLCPFVCTICSKRFELEQEFTLHTEMHIEALDSKEDYSKNRSEVNEKCSQTVDEMREKRQDFLLQPGHHARPERWSPTNLKVYTRRPKKEVSVSSTDTNINTNDVHTESDKDSKEFEVRAKTLSEADSTVPGGTTKNVLSKEFKTSVKRKKDRSRSCVTKKTKKEFITDVGVDGIKKIEVNEDKVDALTTKGSSCIHCNQGFQSEKDYSEHMLVAHTSSSHDPVITQLSTSSTDKSKTSQTEEMSRVSKNDTENINAQTSLTVHQTKKRLIKKTKLWHCKTCKRNFKLIADFIKHKYSYHHDESVVHICENCKKVLTSVAMVNTHMCTKVTLWSCKRCHLKFSNGILLRQHNRECHYEYIGPHVCSTCTKNFLTMSMLERHIYTSHSYRTSESPLLSTSETYHNVNDTASSSTETLTDQVTSGNSVCQSEYPRSGDLPGLERTLWLHHLKKTSLQDCEVVTISRSTLSGKDQFKCNLCESLHVTKLGIKLHLIKQHKTTVDICSLCSKLYIAESIAQHLINEHMVRGKPSTENGNLRNDQKDEITDFAGVLGSKQLHSLCEYRKLGSPMRNKCFKCTMCYREFLNFRFCRTHYFKIHDIVCVLCNEEFVDSRQATDHKLKVHGPVSSYLWAVQKIFAVILQSKKYGTTVQEVVNRLTNTTSKQYSRMKSKSNRNLKKNGHHIESRNLRKTDSSRNGKRRKRMLAVSEVNNVLCENNYNSYCVTEDKISVNVNDVSEQSRCSGTRMNNVQIGEESEVEYTISSSALATCPSVNEEIESCGNAFVLMVTEDDLKLYRNNIKELVSRLCLPSKVFSEEYVTELLLNYVQQIGS